MDTAAATRRDGVRLALLSNRLEGISRKMGNTLQRTGRSGVLNMARDFSCCIVTAGCELAAVAESLPIHVLSGPDMMARAMREFHPELRRGDAYLHNSPYHGCSHPADHTILVPVIDDDGVHRFTVLAKAHQADIGNSIPTTYYSTARDVYEEGALIFPAVKVQQDYRTNMDIVRMCRARIRVPDQWHGDFLAMMGAARIGERELLALGREVGWEELARFTAEWFDYSERRMEAAIAALPAGHAEWTSTHDAIPGTPPEGIPVTVKITLDPAAARVTVDLRDNPDCLPCGLNLSEACARTAAMLGVFNALDHSVPKNAGSFRRIDVLLRENCVVGIPRHPTSCSVATTNVADRVANSVQATIAGIADGIGLAECGAINPPSGGVVSGVDPRRGRAFVNQVFIGKSGGAGAPFADAWQMISHVGSAGFANLDPVELEEHRLPLYVHGRGFLADSEGAGRQRGASSFWTEYGPHGTALDLVYTSDGNVNAPKGVRGGHTGWAARQWRRGRNGALEPAPAAARLRLADGERVVSNSCGGGGYGDPATRDPAAVARDVAEGWITPERARDVYRVALGADGSVDAAVTSRLRGA
ncbi:MAG: hydantoinase B/oxoprolinase family protein [Alphaproteobacteria bacterium]